jgi:hypothetical protein
MTAKDWTEAPVKLVAVHFVPLLVERKTPAPAVPAKRFVPAIPVGLTASDPTARFGKPAFIVVQFLPLSF